MNQITSYKSKIASRYIPVSSEQIGLKIVESDYYFTSVKHDGHLAFLNIGNGKASLLDRSGNEINIPAIIKAAINIKENILLAGEICVFETGQSASHREVAAGIDNPDKVDFRFGVFDVLEHTNAEVNADPSEKYTLIQKTLKEETIIFPIEQKQFTSRADIITFFKAAITDSREGVIVRVPSGITYKIKNSISIDCVVLGYAESTGDRQGWMRELLIGLAIDKDHYQIIGKCSNGFTDAERQEWPQKLEKIIVPSEYTEVSSAKTAIVMVKPDFVIEVSCLELINENSSGPIQKAQLTYSDQNGYAFYAQGNTISLISPGFLRVRDDKKVNEKDTGTSQAYSIVPPLDLKFTADVEKDSSIIHREVYTKAGKGGTAVRKFVGLKTNKENSKLYSPFVLVFSDFSNGRKTPLEQEIFLCQSEKDIENKLIELKEENIKKGWELIK